MSSVSDDELKKVIADFLEMGHVENIVAMFKKEPQCFAWTADILRDERFNVRLGLTIVFEELREFDRVEVSKAIPALQEMLSDESPLLRGDAIGILGLIGTQEAIRLIYAMKSDTDPQVREMVELALAEVQGQDQTTA